MNPTPSLLHNMKLRPLCRILSCVLMLISGICLLASCKSTAPIITQHRNDSIVIHRHYEHDSIYVHDSVVTRYAIGDPDTVYVHKWHTDIRYKVAHKTDTIYQDREVIITPPPERYIPSFYRTCTRLFILSVLLLLAYVFIRLIIKIYLKRS